MRTISNEGCRFDVFPLLYSRSSVLYKRVQKFLMNSFVLLYVTVSSNRPCVMFDVDVPTIMGNAHNAVPAARGTIRQSERRSVLDASQNDGLIVKAPDRGFAPSSV
jgi:hypothetical protein